MMESPLRYYKALTSIILIMVELFNEALSASESSIPGAGLSYIILLFKNGDRGSMTNWWPFALSKCNYKL